MAKIKLECEIAHMMYILLLTATVTQNAIHRNLVTACSRKFTPGYWDLIMLFVGQVFVVNHIIKSFAITFNMERKKSVSYGCL